MFLAGIHVRSRTSRARSRIHAVNRRLNIPRQLISFGFHSSRRDRFASRQQRAEIAGVSLACPHPDELPPGGERGQIKAEFNHPRAPIKSLPLL